MSIQRLREALREFARDVRAPVLVHLVDVTDATAGPTGPIALVDGETGQRIELDVTEDTRARYAEQYAKFREEIEHACRAAGVRYLFVNGTMAIKDGRYTGALAGKVLRHADNAPTR